MYAIRSYYDSDGHGCGRLVHLRIGEKQDAQAGSAVAGAMNNVITSYSIHYTKLYEPRWVVDAVALSSALEEYVHTAHPLAGILRTAICLTDPSPRMDEAARLSGLSVDSLVITSYSIHYTKLYEMPPGRLADR